MADSGELLLEVTQLHKYFGERKVLDGIELQVAKGEVIVILGPSGCGKSTFLRCLNGLEAGSGRGDTISWAEPCGGCCRLA